MAVTAALTGEGVPSPEMFGQYFRHAMPPIPPDDGLATPDLVDAYLDDLVEAASVYLLPLVELAGQAVAELAVARDEIREETLSFVAGKRWD